MKIKFFITKEKRAWGKVCTTSKAVNPNGSTCGFCVLIIKQNEMWVVCAL